MKRKITSFLAMLALTLLTEINAQNIIGYAPYYRNYDSNFDFSKYTHVHYFCIWPAADGSFIWPQKDSTAMANQYQTIATAAHLKGVKMVITFGGTSQNGSKNYAAMASNNIARANFISKAINLCKTWGIDGINIDWEWANHTETQINRDAYTNLMIDMKTATVNNNLSLSTDVSPSSWHGDNYNPSAVKLADYVNVMSYSYNGTWASTTKHHSPLNLTISAGLNYWTGLGITKSKLNIGIPFYAYSYKGTSTYGTAFTSASVLNYTEVKALISNGYTVVEDDNNGTYCYSTIKNEIVFYDSPQNIEAKVNYSKNNNYGGVIIWEIGMDDHQELSSAIYNRTVINGIDDKNANNELISIVQQNKSLIINSQKNIKHLSIFDTSGQSIKVIQNGLKTIDISGIKPGIYILNLEIEAKIINRKIIIE